MVEVWELGEQVQRAKIHKTKAKIKTHAVIQEKQRGQKYSAKFFIRKLEQTWYTRVFVDNCVWGEVDGILSN